VTAVGALFLLGPLVLVPLGFRLIEPGRPLADRLHRLAVRGSWPAGAALALAMALPAGPPATALAVPWLGIAGLRAVAAAAEHSGQAGESHPDARWIDSAAAAFLVVGALWIVADRLGLRPMGFDPLIVRLTAVHFHFAGFGLLLVAGRLTERRPGGAIRAAAVLVVVGMPLVATGFFGAPFVGLIGVVLVVTAGLTIGALHLRLAGSMSNGPARWLARLAGASLLASMPMALLWAVGQIVPIGGIDVAMMIRVHGSLNALGFAVPAVVAWRLDRAPATARRSVAVRAR
jgi:hypothetical protein